MSSEKLDAAPGIWVVSSIPPTAPYAADPGARNQLAFRERVSLKELQQLLAEFTRDLSASFDEIVRVKGAFEIDSIEVSAVMAADGKIGLMGSSLGTKAEGGIRFVFKRRQGQDHAG